MRRRIILTLAILFVGINVILVYLDEEGKVEQKAYISEWSQAFETDLENQLYKSGVLVSTDEEQLYFDESLGSFQQFFVEEGSQVSPGDPLYAYQVDNFQQAESDLMQEVETLNGEIAAIEAAMTRMEMYQVPEESPSPSTSAPPSLPPTPPSVGSMPGSFSSDEPVSSEEITIVLEQEEPADAELIKEQYIIEKEKELAQKTAQLEGAQSRLDALHSTGDTITYESPYEGRVKSVSDSLDNPLITIENIQLQAEGELNEAERTEVAEGMPVKVRLDKTDALIEGEIGSVSESPKTVQIEGESVYPFEVTFREEADVEDLLPGYHANLAITLEASENATALYEELVFNGFVWKLTDEGKLLRQAVDTGIYTDNMYEITNGAAVGEWVAQDPSGQFRDDATFITPLQLREVPWKYVFNGEHWGKNIVIGLLSR
ncbi:efflux RND transporter periplasmic adaptor subunit [Virgibacillus ainsalahensis]